MARRIEKVIDGVGSAPPATAATIPFVDIVVPQTLIRNTCELVREKLRAMDIELTIEAESEDLRARGRAVQLSQVLLNVINNASDSVRTENEK